MFDTEEQANERTEERVWIKHLLRLTLCECWVCKLLNCNSRTSVEKTCNSGSEVAHLLHTHHEAAISD